MDFQLYNLNKPDKPNKLESELSIQLGLAVFKTICANSYNVGEENKCHKNTSKRRIPLDFQLFLRLRHRAENFCR